MFIRHGIPVLLQETLDFVGDIQSIVSDGEGRIAKARLLENILELGFGKDLCVQFLQKCTVTAGWQPRLFVEESQHSKFAFDNVNAWLIVREIDERPVDFLLDVFLLLKFEDVGVELKGDEYYSREKTRQELTSC